MLTIYFHCLVILFCDFSSNNDSNVHYLEDLVALLCQLYEKEKIRAGTGNLNYVQNVFGCWQSYILRIG